MLCSFVVHGFILSFVFVFLPYLGSTLTPLTPIPVSDVGKSMLPSPSLSVLGDQQFQTGRCLLALINLIRTKLFKPKKLMIFSTFQLEVEVLAPSRITTKMATHNMELLMEATVMEVLVAL